MSVRNDAMRLADTIASDPREFGYEDWVEAAKKAQVEFPIASVRAAVITILEDRAKNPDPTAGFPS